MSYLSFSDVYMQPPETKGEFNHSCMTDNDCNSDLVCQLSAGDRKCGYPSHIKDAYRDPIDGICSVVRGNGLRVMLPEQACGRTQHFNRMARDGGVYSEKGVCDANCRTLYDPIANKPYYGRQTRNGFQACHPLCSSEPPGWMIEETMLKSENPLEPEYLKFTRSAHYYGYLS